jgi:hypothetical protein
VIVILYFLDISIISSSFSCQIPNEELDHPVDIFAKAPEFTHGLIRTPQDVPGKSFPKYSS